MDKQFYVYILADRMGGALYVGVSGRLPQRIWEHKNGVFDSFTKRFGIDKLVWYEVHDNAEAAITREKQIKDWKRAWKIELIERDNPNWVDRYPAIASDSIS